MNNFEFYSPTAVYFGRDNTGKIGPAIRQFGGSKVLLHYGSDRVLKNGLMDKVVASLKAEGLEYVMLGGVVPNPRVALVREGAELCRREKVDFIFAVGGGSVIDSAKGIAIAACNDFDVWDAYSGKVEIEKALPNANILTLAAAGSETSKHTVLTNEEGWLKRGYGSSLLRPCFCVLDPELLYTLPPYQTASGIVDILMHTLDRYFTPGGYTETTDVIAEQILRIVMRYGKLCMENPKDYQARAEVLWAGSLSHNDLTGLGRIPDFAAHDLEHELSALYDVTHGAGLAAVWGSWARYVYKANVMRFARYATNVLDIPLDFINPENTALEGIRKTEEYFASIDMPINITDLVGKEVSDADIELMAEKCSNGGRKTIGSFKKLGKADMLEIYKNSR